VWDLRTGNPTTIIRAFETQATSAVFGPGFSILASSRDNAIKVIDGRTFETLQTLWHPEFLTSLNWSRAVFSPSGNLVASGSGNGAVYVWDVQVGRVAVCALVHVGGLVAGLAAGCLVVADLCLP
jgi:WD40 repeat protein